MSDLKWQLLATFGILFDASIPWIIDWMDKRSLFMGKSHSKGWKKSQQKKPNTLPHNIIPEMSPSPPVTTWKSINEYLLPKLKRTTANIPETIDDVLHSPLFQIVLALILFVLAYIRAVSVAVAITIAAAWLVTVYGIARYRPIKELPLKARLVLTIVCAIILFFAALLFDRWALSQASSLSLSITASRAIGYKDGDNVHGIAWRGDFRAVRMTLKISSEYPLHNIDLTVKVIDKDVLSGMGEITDIPGCQFYGPKWPDLGLELHGVDDHWYPLHMEDDLGNAPYSSWWKMYCPALPAGLPITLIIATNPGREIPKRLRAIGSCQQEPGSVIKFDKLVEVVGQ